MHLGHFYWISTAARASMKIQTPIQPSNYAQRPIATALTIEQAHLPAKLRNMTIYSVPVKTGKLVPSICDTFVFEVL